MQRKIKIKRWEDPSDFEKFGEALPCSDDAEKGALSCFLQNPDALLDDAKESLPPSAFYHPANVILYSTLLSMREKGMGIDIVTVSQNLIDSKKMEECGGPGFIAELLDFVPCPVHYPLYKGILKDKLMLRTVAVSSHEIKLAALGQGDMQEFREEVEKKVSAISQAIQPEEKSSSLLDQLGAWHDDWEERRSGRKQSAMPSRWPSMNQATGGLKSGYRIVSGPYSSGKSVMVNNDMADACILKGNRPGLLVNYEMPVCDVLSRLISDVGNVHGGCTFLPDKRKPSQTEMRAITDAISKIGKSKLKIIHEPHLSADGVCHIARSMWNQHKDLVVGVDYLQKVPAPKNIEKGANHERELSVNSDTFQKLSKELGIPVMVLCQNNKDGSSRGSMSIEMDCDEAFVIEDEKGIYIKKNRNGERNIYLPIFLNKPFFRFEERDEPTFP